MSFVSLGDNSATPSFLELVAAHKLDRSIRDAFSYVLSVFADRVPHGGLRLLQMDTELYLLFSLVVQGTSVLTNGASLAESLYGLRRVSALAPGQPTTSSPSLRQLWLSIVFLAGAPYIANLVFGDPREAAIGTVTARANISEQSEGDTAALQPSPHASDPAANPSPLSDTHDHIEHSQEHDAVPRSHSLQQRPALQRLQKLRQIIQTAVLHMRRHGHMTAGLINLGYEAAYLLKVTPFFSPALHCAGITLVRDDGSAGRARLQAQAETCSRLWAHGVSNRAPAALMAAVGLRSIHAIGNNAKTSLLATLVLFKVLEWWFTAGEAKVDEARRYVPPPPPAYPQHPAGVPLIADASVCPICHRQRVAPAQLATSGYVFCYKCIYTAVAAHGQCPVTHVRAALDDIRRLFLTA